FDDIPKKILFSGGGQIGIIRENQPQQGTISVNFICQFVEKKKSKSSFFLPRIPAKNGDFDKNNTSRAKKTGIKIFDKIVKVDSEDINFLDEAAAYFGTRKNQTVMLTVERKGQTLMLPVKLDENGKMNPTVLTNEQYDSLGVLHIQHTPYGFFSAFPA